MGTPEEAMSRIGQVMLEMMQDMPEFATVTDPDSMSLDQLHVYLDFTERAIRQVA